MPYLYEEVPLCPFTVLVLAAPRERSQIGRLLQLSILKMQKISILRKQSEC